MDGVNDGKRYGIAFDLNQMCLYRHKVDKGEEGLFPKTVGVAKAGRSKVFLFYKRPGFVEFLEYVNTHFRWFAYTTMTKDRAQEAIRIVFPEHLRPRFIWHQNTYPPRIHIIGEKNDDGDFASTKNITDLFSSDVWENSDGFFKAENTWLVDDSSDKIKPCRTNAMVVPSFTYEKLVARNDDVLPTLKQHLQRLIEADEPQDVRDFILTTPFAPPPEEDEGSTTGTSPTSSNQTTFLPPGLNTTRNASEQPNSDPSPTNVLRQTSLPPTQTLQSKQMQLLPRLRDAQLEPDDVLGSSSQRGSDATLEQLVWCGVLVDVRKQGVVPPTVDVKMYSLAAGTPRPQFGDALLFTGDYTQLNENVSRIQAYAKSAYLYGVISRSDPTFEESQRLSWNARSCQVAFVGANKEDKAYLFPADWFGGLDTP
ncbi:hypothetical protein HDV00_000319, partial [Rhizophlyctis rosea]